MTGLVGKKVRIGPSFVSVEKYIVRGLNGYNGNFGDEKSSMLWVDGGELHISRKVVQELLKIPKALVEDSRSGQI